MGKLALWGAVAGGAKGYQKELANRETREAVKLDEEREMRFAKMKMEHDESQSSRSEAHAEKLQGMRGDQAIAQIGEQGDVTTDVNEAKIDDQGVVDLRKQDDQQGHDTTERGLDRASRERIARYGATAKATAASKRFQAKTLTVAEANAEFPMLKNDVDTPGVFDTQSGKWYLQKGDMLLYPGDEAPAKEERAPASAVEDLYNNPSRLSEFYSWYGYLPADVLEILNTAAAAAPVAPAAPTATP